MKIKKLTAAIIAALVIVMGCASGPKASKSDELDLAIRDASDYLNDNIPKGSKIVILNVQSDSNALSDYIIDELIANAVNDHVFQVVDRQQLDLIRKEQNFQWSGEVDDKLALTVGKFFGAQTIVSGAISELGDRYRMRIRALNVQTSQVQGQYNRNITAGKTITALMNSKSGALRTASGNTGGTTSGTSGKTGTGGQTAAQATPARLANGKYIFSPRLQAYREGIPIEVWIYQIVVRGNYFLVYVGNAARGPAPNSYVMGFEGENILTNLDNPIRTWTARGTKENDRDLGNTIFSFQNVTGTRFSLENLEKGDQWFKGVFEEIDLSKANFEP